MSKNEIDIIEGWDNDEAHDIDQALSAHNKGLGLIKDQKELCLCIKTDTGKMRAGATIQLAWDYVFIDHLYVWDKSAGLGSLIMKKIDEIAKHENKKGIYVYTSMLQAPEFYKKNGFREVGRLPKFTNNVDEVLFIKEISYQ